MLSAEPKSSIAPGTSSNRNATAGSACARASISSSTARRARKSFHDISATSVIPLMTATLRIRGSGFAVPRSRSRLLPWAEGVSAPERTRCGWVFAYAGRVQVTAFFRRRVAESEYDYPLAVPVFAHIAVVAIAGAAVAQRDGFVPPGVGPAVWPGRRGDPRCGRHDQTAGGASASVPGRRRHRRGRTAAPAAARHRLRLRSAHPGDPDRRGRGKQHSAERQRR